MTGRNSTKVEEILFRKEIGPDNQHSIPVKVARAVANASGKQIHELEPLYSYVDSEALKDLLDTDTYLDISFSYEGFRVNIQGAESVEITIVDK